VVQQHRGNIDVKSETGMGTTVRIRLPVDVAGHQAEQA